MIIILLVCLNIFCLSALVVPAWYDYFCKDYICYTGEFEVTFENKKWWIKLEDGTDIRSRDLDEGSYYGTIVYARNSKVLLGILAPVEIPNP